ncbi:MAG: peptidylprolyl isomerase [Acidobacteriaceae bacterium]
MARTAATMLALLLARATFGQARPQILQGSAGPQKTQTAVLDRVVAVVDETAILASDVDEEMRFAALQPEKEPAADNTPQRALSRLIDRALIDRQRLLQPGLADVSQTDVDRAVENLRKTIPGCRQYHCTEAAGWFAFLKAHEFTVQEVDERVRERLEALKFIDMRFGNAARIPRADVQKYYDDVLRPALQRNHAVVPEMKAVAPRIREILRQQQIGAMVDEWLKGLHSEGQVHVLDSAYASGGDFGGAGRAQ